MSVDLTAVEYGLKPHVIKKIRTVFAQHPAVSTVYLYGSRAKGTYRKGSDIDLTIASDSLDWSELLKIENELDDLLLPYKIDLSLLSHIQDGEVLAHIQRVGKVFYENANRLNTPLPTKTSCVHRTVPSPT